MNLVAGSWPRFWIATLIAPWTLLAGFIAVEWANYLIDRHDVFDEIAFRRVLPLRAVLIGWIWLAATLLMTGLVLRRLRKTTTRHHVIGSIITWAIVMGGLLVADAFANELPLADAVIVNNPYCDPSSREYQLMMLFTVLKAVSALLVITIPTLVFKWIAYGFDREPHPAPKWRIAGIVYSVGLVMAVLLLLATRFQIVNDYHLWC
jgi:hypothetical protein